MIGETIAKINVIEADSTVIRAEYGQIRKDERGRIILVIRNDKYIEEWDGDRVESTTKALVLKTGERDGSTPFETIPADYTLDEITERYPLVLDGDINVIE